jgi:WW domain-binding protein 4
MSSNNTNKRKAPWENNERHYCKTCNVWMGSDRQSILLHETGKRHKEKTDELLKESRLVKQKHEQTAKFLQQSMAKNDIGRFGSHAGFPPIPAPLPISHVPPPPPMAPVPTTLSKNEKKEWESRKKQRENEKRKRSDSHSDDDNTNKQPKKITIQPNEGYYTVPGSGGSGDDDIVYLEGVVFGDILEEEMPIQLWTGARTANSAEKQLVERTMLWKDALVAALRRRSSSKTHEDRMVVDVAYLACPDDADETLETSVSLNRIRIRLGADASIPETLEEARILAMGGEEIEFEIDQDQQTIDEATGLTSWSTVRVKRTTIRQEIKEERARLREKRRQSALEAETLHKRLEERKMEEAKVANADDSALGAYDVWSRTKDGYKGVNIHADVKVDIHETGKKLSEGQEKVSFKKTAFKRGKVKQSRRTTSAEDD